MKKLIKNIAINIDQCMESVGLRVVQFDTNIWQLKVKLWYNGQFYGPSGMARLWATKPDGKKVYINGNIEADGTILLEVGGQIFTASGEVRCEIELSDQSQNLGIPTFKIVVMKSERDNNAVESTDDFSALQDALRVVDHMLIKTDIADNLTTNDATKVLSAAQGKVLKDSLEDYVQKDNVYTIQGVL